MPLGSFFGLGLFKKLRGEPAAGEEASKLALLQGSWPYDCHQHAAINNSIQANV